MQNHEQNSNGFFSVTIPQTAGIKDNYAYITRRSTMHYGCLHQHVTYYATPHRMQHKIKIKVQMNIVDDRNM